MGKGSASLSSFGLKPLEALEDEYDARVADIAWAEYQADLANGIEPITLEQMARGVGH